MKRNTAAQPDARDLVRELEMIFEQLRRHERAADADQSEESLTKLGKFKRGAVERVNHLMPALSNHVLDGSVWEPNLLDQFDGFWSSVPDPRQTSLTWGPYLARLRQVLLLAMGAREAAASLARKLSSHADGPAATGAGDADLERASPGSSGLNRAALRQAKATLTCKDIAEDWSLGRSTVRRIFQDEPGVLRLSHSGRRGKRDYVSLRIPAAVAARVRARLTRTLFKVE